MHRPTLGSSFRSRGLAREQEGSVDMYPTVRWTRFALLCGWVACVWSVSAFAATQPQGGGVIVEVEEEDIDVSAEAPATPPPTETQPPASPATPETPQKATAEKPAEAVPADDPDEVIVISSTLTPQKVEEAPSIITVITREQILAMGYRSLTEVLRNVVGLGINDNGHWPDTGVRGVNDRTTYGDKIQMLVDGHNMSWRQFNRNYHSPAWISLDEVARIEVIRGPGSAIWGANALTGVVNIVTRSWQYKDSAEMSVGADGALDSRFIFARAATQLEELSLYGSFHYYEDNADALLSPIREYEQLNSERVFVTGDDEHGLRWNLKASYDQFTVSYIKSRWDSQAPLSTFSVLGGDDSRFVTDRDILVLNYDQILVPGLDLNAQLHLDFYEFDEGTAYEDNPMADTLSDPATGGSGRFLRKMSASDRRYDGKLTLSYVPTLTVQALVGADVEYLDIVRWHFPEVWQQSQLEEPTFTNWHAGAFGQLQYSPIPLLALTGGARFDYDQIYGAVTTPRAGVVLRLPAGFTVKGLFGTAFKAPSFHDLYYYRKGAFYGSPDLEPETATTGEGQIIYKHARTLDIHVTGFYTRINNLIGYSKREAGLALDGESSFPVSQRPGADKDYSQKANLSHVTTKGVEVEASLRPHHRVTVSAHGTYRIPEDADGERLHYSAKWIAGGAVTFKLHEHLGLTLRGIGVGNKTVPARQLGEKGYPSWTAEEDPTLETPSYFLGTVVVSAENLMGKGVDLYLKLDNVNDTEWWDAGREVLYPQRRFQTMLWLSAPL